MKPLIYLEIKTATSSTVRPATREEIEACDELAAKGACPHTVVTDEVGFIYNIRYCAVCLAGLALI